MEVNEFITSGILELYVYGVATEAEVAEVERMAAEHQIVRDEIKSIETAVVSLSYTMAPYLSGENYQRIAKAIFGNEIQAPKPVKVIGLATYIGYAASVLFLLGCGYLFFENQNKDAALSSVNEEKVALTKKIDTLNQVNESRLALVNVLRSKENTVIDLAGQAIAPESSARIYWNKASQEVYVDIASLPEPPEGKVYQIWSLKLVPQLTPTSIGTIANYDSSAEKIFKVEPTGDAEAFGITLEPEGGSATPTMEQLYALGKV